MSIINKLFSTLIVFTCQTLAGDESDVSNLIELRWNIEDINLNNGRDIILLDASSCMILAPVYYEPGLAKYDPSSFSPNKNYYWMSVSRIRSEISLLNYGSIVNNKIDVSEKIEAGRFVTIEGLDISKKYVIYKIVDNVIDPYFIYSNFGTKTIDFKEKLSLGKYLILEKQEQKITSKKMFDVLANDDKEMQILQWPLIIEERLGFDVSNLREYCEVSSLCNLFYRKYRNPENSTFSYSHGYTFSFDE